MPEGLNKVFLIGNLGQDPELRYTKNGDPVLRLRLATTEIFINRAGERTERTEWHTVIVWGKRGAALNTILQKGRQIFVEGRLQSRQWEDNQGNKRTAVEIIATNIVLLGKKEGGEPERLKEIEGGLPVDEEYSGEIEDIDDDLPF